MNIFKNTNLNSFKDELGRLFMISFGVFLFILFFQPFPLEMLNYNNRLLYVAGFGGITFILSFIILILIPLNFSKWFKISEWESGPPFILSLLLFVLMNTAFAFYIHFVGKISLSLYILFKAALVCLLPILIFVILYKNKSLERIIGVLKDQNKSLFAKLNELEKTSGENLIEIVSSNNADKLSLKSNALVYIKSADNYTEIYYLENDALEKKLIRNTLKDVEIQLSNFKNIIRCHRTSLVNISFTEKISRNYSGYYLKLNYLDETIPISRQYIIQVKEALSAIQ